MTQKMQWNLRARRIIPRVLCAFAMLFLAAGSEARADTALWQAIRSGGHVVVIRHALAPGVGDPPHFQIEDCGTQRTLNDPGRAQARRIGDIFRRNGIAVARMYSSQWCRCLDTARLMNLGPVGEMQDLNSFFGKHERREAQTAALKSWIAAADLSPTAGPVVLVTHQVNIRALTGKPAAFGEMIVLRRDADGTFTVAGSIRTD